MNIERSKFIPADMEEWNNVMEQVKHGSDISPKDNVAIDLINGHEYTFEDEASFILGYN